MRNLYLSAGTEDAIDKQVAKVLRGLGNPEPPLELELVFELLKLDAQFYTTTEDGVFRETISRIKVGTIQVFKRPMLLLEALTKSELKALYIPDKKRILVDSTLPDLKVRWHTAHEVTHSICDWHGDVLFGDNFSTLSQGCHEQIEAEANYGTGRLLTLHDRFTNQVAGATLTLKDISNLAKTFGNTWTSTLWRVVETLDVPAFAVVGSHPKKKGSTDPCRYFIRSRSFESEYGSFTEEEAGEHFTPRDVVKLMAELIFRPIAEDVKDGTYTVYDGACGTGGMLTIAEQRLQELGKAHGKAHGKQVSVHLFGQEVNAETYAITKADLLLKGEGEEAENFTFGGQVELRRTSGRDLRRWGEASVWKGFARL